MKYFWLLYLSATFQDTDESNTRNSLLCLSKPLHVVILLEQCIMQQLSVASSSLCPCSEIIQRETVHMKAEPLTPLWGKQWETRVAEQIHICHQLGRGERQIRMKSHREKDRKMLLLSVCSLNSVFKQCFLIQGKFVEMLLHVPIREMEPCESLRQDVVH